MKGRKATNNLKIICKVKLIENLLKDHFKVVKNLQLKEIM